MAGQGGRRGWGGEQIPDIVLGKHQHLEGSSQPLEEFLQGREFRALHLDGVTESILMSLTEKEKKNTDLIKK